MALGGRRRRWAVLGPLLLAVTTEVGLGWRGLFVAFAFSTLLLVLVVRRSPEGGMGGTATSARRAARDDPTRGAAPAFSLADPLPLTCSLHSHAYLVDDIGASVTAGGLAVAVWTGFGLLGSAALIPLLRRVDGLRYLRGSGARSRPLRRVPIVPGVGPKLVLVAALALVNAGWYPVLQARLYDALGESSSLVLTVGILFPLDAVLPLAIAGLAGRFGLSLELWPLLLAPAALLALVPRR
jgi:FSR family fosmidomycin resistance protein-like MFS transporter